MCLITISFLGILIEKWGHTSKNYGYFMAIYSKKIGVLNQNH